jgi:hypothetical protein
VSFRLFQVINARVLKIVIKVTTKTFENQDRKTVDNSCKTEYKIA